MTPIVVIDQTEVGIVGPNKLVGRPMLVKRPDLAYI